MRNILALLVVLININSYSQNRRPPQQEVNLKGVIIEKESKQVLEYATVVMQHVKTKKVSGGITNSNGIFTFDVRPGVYNISFEFIGFKKYKLLNQKITTSRDFGTISLSSDYSSLDEVEIKLDKKIYNVGKDMFKKKATLTVNVSDVFNSRKFSGTNFTPTTVSESDFQFRQRSVNLAFSYRFNQKKKRERQERGGRDGGGEEFGG